MSNVTQKWREGWLEDHPLSRYEKLKSTRRVINDDKHRTIARKKARTERWIDGSRGPAER